MPPNWEIEQPDEYVEELSKRTDRQLLEELVVNSRKLAALAESFVKSVESNPMLSKMGSMFGMGKR